MFDQAEKLFDEEKISEAEFLERRVNDVKPHMDNLHSWLLEKKQKEMILDSSKTKETKLNLIKLFYCFSVRKCFTYNLSKNIVVMTYRVVANWFKFCNINFSIS